MVADGFDDGWTDGIGLIAIPFVTFDKGPETCVGVDLAEEACVRLFCEPFCEPFCESSNEPTVAPIIKGPLVLPPLLFPPVPRLLLPLLLVLPLPTLTLFVSPTPRFGDLLDCFCIAEVVDLLGDVTLAAEIAAATTATGAMLLSRLERKLLFPSYLLLI